MFPRFQGSGIYDSGGRVGRFLAACRSDGCLSYLGRLGMDCNIWRSQREGCAYAYDWSIDRLTSCTLVRLIEGSKLECSHKVAQRFKSSLVIDC